jgi:hypothetical protein
MNRSQTLIGIMLLFVAMLFTVTSVPAKELPQQDTIPTENFVTMKEVMDVIGATIYKQPCTDNGTVIQDGQVHPGFLAANKSGTECFSWHYPRLKDDFRGDLWQLIATLSPDNKLHYSLVTQEYGNYTTGLTQREYGISEEDFIALRDQLKLPVNVAKPIVIEQ